MSSRNWQVQLKTLLQLGVEQTGLYGVYQLGLKTGQIARQTPVHPILPVDKYQLVFPWRRIPAERLAAIQSSYSDDLKTEADAILAGNFRCFGGALRPIQLRPPAEPRHWSIPIPEATAGDIKSVWEPARFGWAILLARAYARFDDERYPQAFWERLEEFAAFNPANAGPNWASAQEVALRLMAVGFAAAIFQASPHTTAGRLEQLRGFLIAHAERIPPTLSYAQAQNNNHLLSEAAGLWTAARLLPDHPAARRWNALGQANFNRGIQKQVAFDGTYAQHSVNYHRLMLHTALWIYSLYQGERAAGEIFTPQALARLRAAVGWLLAQADAGSGLAPNYGHNDGANILPLACAGTGDQRPALQAAGQIFLQQALFPPGPWDEICLWLGCAQPRENAPGNLPESSPILRLDAPQSWAVLRSTRYHSRPAHADQLHVDVWFQGYPLALDAGTYLYNAPSPWENALAGVSVHNTVQVDGLEPMTRAGRFLWLDWDQSVLLNRDEAAGIVAARRDGYRRMGVLHERRLCRVDAREWRIIDRLLPAGRRPRPHNLRLHWLIDDLPWTITGQQVELAHPAGPVRLRIDCEAAGQICLDRAGERIYGEGAAAPIAGWHSPTYGIRQPALSLSFTCRSDLPLEIHSIWQLPA